MGQCNQLGSELHALEAATDGIHCVDGDFNQAGHAYLLRNLSEAMWTIRNEMQEIVEGL